MVAPALLCGSLIGSLPVFTIVAFFAATVFRNTQLGEEPHAARLKHPTVEEAAPFLLFLFLLVIDVILKVTKERQVRRQAHCNRELSVQTAMSFWQL